MKSLHGRTELKPYALLIRADLVQIQRPAQHLLVCLLRVLPSLNRARNNFRAHFLGGSCPSELKCNRRLWCQWYLTRTHFELPWLAKRVLVAESDFFLFLYQQWSKLSSTQRPAELFSMIYICHIYVNRTFCYFVWHKSGVLLLETKSECMSKLLNSKLPFRAISFVLLRNSKEIPYFSCE